MSELNFTAKFDPGQRMLESTYKNSFQRDKFILSRGIVLDVKRSVNYDTVTVNMVPHPSVLSIP